MKDSSVSPAPRPDASRMADQTLDEILRRYKQATAASHSSSDEEPHGHNPAKTAAMRR